MDHTNMNSTKSTSALDLALRLLTVILLLYFFLVGIQVLGGSFKMLGGGFTQGILNVSSNVFVSLLAGMLATVLVQSSSVTTSIIVGLVSSGTLPFDNAIPMIMGANLGTSITNTLASLGYLNNHRNFGRAFAAGTIHDFFNILSVLVLLPIEVATGFLSKSSQYLAHLIWGNSSINLTYESPVKNAIKPIAGALKYFVTDILGFEGTTAGVVLALLSAGLIVFALSSIVRVMKVVVESNKGEILENLLGKNSYLTMLFGILLTISVQSSSITTSLLVPMAGSGLLSLQSILPVTVGANIGTTTTAILAATAGNVSGLAIAFVHLLFNVCGTLIWFVPKIMRMIPIQLASGLGELVQKKRRYGVIYILVVFFIIPFSMVFAFK